MMQLDFQVVKAGDVGRVVTAIKKAQRNMLQIMNSLRTEIMVNRLSKGEPGKPAYPQVLCRNLSHLNRGIFTAAEMRGEDVAGRCGTNIFYGAIHEMREIGDVINIREHHKAVRRTGAHIGHRFNKKTGMYTNVFRPATSTIEKIEKHSWIVKYNRQWLRPALRDKLPELLKQFGVIVATEISELQVGYSK
jgi:hypothetical protein